MVQILRATCINGELVMDQRLGPELEGQVLELIVRSLDEPPGIEFEQKFAQFAQQAQAYSAKLPADYKFDRNEIYDR
jgi:hypothetical protein